MDPPRPGIDFYLEGEPHVDPVRFIEHYCARHGITPAQLGVQPVVVAAFNDDLVRYLAESCGGKLIEPWFRARGDAYNADGVSIVNMQIGAPVAVAVAEELYVLGMRTLIVTGAAGSLQPSAPLGTIVVPTSAIREEGTSHHYAPHDALATPDESVVSVIRDVLAGRQTPYQEGINWTTDAIYREHKAKIARYREAGVLTVDMELSALFTLGAYRGIACGAVLSVSDELHGDTWDVGFGSDAVQRGMTRAGRVALEAASRIARAPKMDGGER